MTTDTDDLVELAFLRWIERGMEFDPDPGRWPLEARGLRHVAAAKYREYIVAELWKCEDILPDSHCDRLKIPRGSTYGEAVQKIWREHLGEEDKPGA